MILTSADRPASTRAFSPMRIVVLLLCVLVLCSIIFPYSQGIHAKQAEETVVFSGLDFLKGVPPGLSSGWPHPLLLVSVVSIFMAAVMLVARPRARSLPVILLGLSTLCVALFQFDIRFSSSGEYTIAAGTASFAWGWLLALLSMIAALIITIVDNSRTALAEKKKFLASISKSGTLPEGYHIRTTREIIVMDFKKHWMVYLLILPTLIYYIVWAYGPLYGIIIAFNDFSAKKGILGSKWVGLQWFREFFRSPFAYRTIRNTLIINFYNLLICFPAPIILALMLNEMRSVRYKRTVQTLTYMPYFISLVVLCGILVDFSSTDGLFGTIMKNMGLPVVNLLGDSKYFRAMYIGSELWQRLGWDSIIFLSALASIDQELYEAATIDGAGRWKQTLHITLPGIMPTIAILMILRIGSMMNVGYEKIILIYNPLTYDTSDVVSSYVYRKGIVDTNFSFSTAVNLFNSLINFVLVIVANRASGKLTETSLW